MFQKLRSRIVLITMIITTIVLLAAGGSIMLFSSTMRPEPKPRQEYQANNLNSKNERPSYEAELEDYIKNDRKEGETRLLMTLFGTGIIIELLVFVVTFYLSQKIVAPVKDSYDKQKIFIANASHELKTPLAVIQANIEALEVDKNNEKWKKNIETEVTHANKLVLNLLQLARMDASSTKNHTSDSQNHTPENFNLASEIKKHIEMFSPKFKGRIVFKSKTEDLCSKLPRQDFLQILDILLDNATKYGEKTITITLEHNRLSVENDGKTIAKKDSLKIFDRFYQIDKTNEGSGLGLAIAKALCEQNNWQITCVSKNGTTIFTLDF